MSFAHQGHPPDSFGSLGRAENDVVHPKSDQNETRENQSHWSRTGPERERESERERVLRKRGRSLCVWEKSWWLNLSVRDGVGIGAGGSTHTPQSTWSPCKVQVHACSWQDPAHHLHWQSFYQSISSFSFN